MSLYKKIVLGILIFVILVFIGGVIYYAYVMFNNGLEGKYCGDDGCVVIKGKKIKYYPENNIKNIEKDNYAVCNDYDHSDPCKLKLHELTDKYAGFEYLGDSYVFYKAPYKPEKINKIDNFKLPKKIYRNKSRTREIYIYDLDHVVMAEDGTQFWGSLKPVSVGYDRFYHLELDVYDNEQGWRVDSVPKLVYDKQDNSIMGFVDITKGSEKYLDLSVFDNKGNYLGDDGPREYYGKYVLQSDKYDSTIEIDKDKMTLSIGNNKHTFPYYVDHANTGSIILKEDDGMNIDTLYHFDRESKEIMVIDTDDFDILDLEFVVYKKVS